MAVFAKPDCLRTPRLALAFLTVLVCLPSAAQTRLSLAECGARKAPDFTPLHAGETVIVRGTVNATAYHFPDRTLLAIQDANGGIALKAPMTDNRLDNFRPGDVVEAQGPVSALAGMVVVAADQLRLVLRTVAPAPKELSVAELMGFRHLGQLVRTSGHVLETGDTVAGPYMLISSGAGPYRVFMPQTASQSAASLAGFKEGDQVQVTGTALQYCPRAPYNGWFELLLSSPTDVVVTASGWFVPPLVLGSTTSAVLLVSFFLWSREHRLRKQRERLRRTFQLGEEILGAASAETILKRIGESLPGILGVTRVHLYVHNRAAKTLDTVGGENGKPESVSLSSPPGGAAAGAVACFHYRTLLLIPDIERSPFPIVAGSGQGIAKSLLFAPMMAQGEVIGVLELDQDDRVRDFTPDEQALAQHLGNQIGVAVRLLDQRSVQEQLFRTEKLAAVGRLISGVVNELEMPLSSICDLAKRALERGPIGPAEREISAIAAEAQKASAMVARLVSFAAAEQVEARPVCISTLLRDLVEFRAADWKASGIRVNDLTTNEPFFVLGSQGQLEQVFLNLLVHAEQSLADAPQKAISIRSTLLAKRLVVEIAFSAAPETRKAEETAAVLGITRGVIVGHGGEVRLVERKNVDPCFEVELPVLARDRNAATAGNGADEDVPHGTMTALIIEPDDAAQRQMLGLLSARSCRVVPVTSSDTGLEMAQRMRFDVAFCSLHAPGLNWVELSERLQSRVGGFVLLSDGYNSELATDFEGDGRYVLAKPVQEAELERILRAVERAAPSKNRAATSIDRQLGRRA